jgi:hypothetical protein
MDIWIPLIAAVIGGLIATIPTVISNRAQAKEREKERDEQRREAKTQLALELTRNDVKILEDGIDDAIKGLGIINLTYHKKRSGELSHDEFVADILSLDGRFVKTSESVEIANKIAASFGEEFFAQYDEFSELCQAYADQYFIDQRGIRADHSEVMDRITKMAGKLHTMLREKLISIRDS